MDFTEYSGKANLFVDPSSINKSGRRAAKGKISPETKVTVVRRATSIPIRKIIYDSVPLLKRLSIRLDFQKQWYHHLTLFKNQNLDLDEIENARDILLEALHRADAVGIDVAEDLYPGILYGVFSGFLVTIPEPTAQSIG